ncbi:MAG: lysophospholipid acyltransferase family protein [Desulfobacterales bacterium]|nr:lysophospholipid acyltransferase family protein [Desulfobacterales bacterium]MBF0395524.1 lysophospholipid acyltransferase family protein [Desulfobacterales bacterium]
MKNIINGKENSILSLISWIITLIVRIWFGLVKVKFFNKEIYETYFIKNNGKTNVVAVSWHRNAIFIFYFFGRKLKHPKAVMVSKSKDGEIVAKVAKYFGYHTARGSSSRSGKTALLDMIDFLKDEKKGKFCGTPVDGPQGPARKVKKGMLVLAKETGSLFIPMAISGTSLLTFRKAWDKTIIPLPFSTVVLGFNSPIIIPPDLSDEEMEKVRQNVEDSLNDLTDKVDDMCHYKG